MSNELGSLDISRRFGEEHFHYDGENLAFELLDFLQWSSSDLVSNATRGVLA